MKRFLALAAIAAACALGACSTTGAKFPSIDQAQARTYSEAAFATSAALLEASMTTGVLTGANLAQARTVFEDEHVALLLGRAGFVAAGAPSTPALGAAVAESDAIYARVHAQLLAQDG